MIAARSEMFRGAPDSTRLHALIERGDLRAAK